MNSPTTRTKRQLDLEGKIRNLDDDSRTAKPCESRNQNKQRQFNLNDDQPQQRPSSSSSSSWWWYQFLFFTMTCPIKLTTLAVIISRWTRMVKEYTQQISQIRYVPRKKKRQQLLGGRCRGQHHLSICWSLTHKCCQMRKDSTEQSRRNYRSNRWGHFQIFKSRNHITSNVELTDLNRSFSDRGVWEWRWKISVHWLEAE